MTMQSDFDCSDILFGETVLCGKVPQDEPNMVGYVTRAASNSVNAMVYRMKENGYAFVTGLRHRDDPWIKSHPNCMDEQAPARVFTEGPGILRRRALEKQVLELVAEVTALKAGREPTCPEAPAKRKRGRPKKVVDPPETEVQ